MLYNDDDIPTLATLITSILSHHNPSNNGPLKLEHRMDSSMLPLSFNQKNNPCKSTVWWVHSSNSKNLIMISIMWLSWCKEE